MKDFSSYHICVEAASRPDLHRMPGNGGLQHDRRGEKCSLIVGRIAGNTIASLLSPPPPTPAFPEKTVTHFPASGPRTLQWCNPPTSAAPTLPPTSSIIYGACLNMTRWIKVLQFPICSWSLVKTFSTRRKHLCRVGDVARASTRPAGNIFSFLFKPLPISSPICFVQGLCDRAGGLL